MASNHRPPLPASIAMDLDPRLRDFLQPKVAPITDPMELMAINAIRTARGERTYASMAEYNTIHGLTEKKP